ncbi:GntR family transcriptional regulator [Evansella cellulosilytica]|uniref:Transcriptional regulator, GntR family n=1 Tax=Evansella cellulosilytica (strain ATCC 21833 / DSM 2522 / FERM P-1141 / JCM 9156 / N-4) TaxID=649639 RepID=E6TW96_EVAC2|nr:GntR family transcriptional regulator [Evansella cellulosilytica]ADU31052.1 transcriptional regulator, GntR family [Evansella cellulosilytica DSM 2522]
MAKEKLESLHHKLKKQIIQNIQNGTYKSEDKLPTEMQLCNEYNVSRTTVRIALQQLVAEGRIYKIQGKGTFVSSSKIHQSLTTAKKGFTKQMIEQGYEPSTKVLVLDVIPADETVAGPLQIKENDPVTKLVRIRYANEDPLQYEIAYIPWGVAPGLSHDKKECENSLFQLLEKKYDVKIERTVEAIEPILSNKEISNYLNIKEGSPIFSLETTTYNTKQQVIEYSKAYFRGDRSKFVIERLYNEN